MRLKFEKRLRALERTVITKPIAPFVIYTRNDEDEIKLGWIGWFDNGVCKSWDSRDGHVPEALQLQIRA
jgi:hypothetical protein